MTDKVLYQCPECGNVRLVSGPVDAPNAGRICQSGEGEALCLASMLQVWPVPSAWISVEGMPDDAGQCLVEASTSYGPPPSVFMAWRREGRWAWASSAAFWYATPTRYMPIPSTEEVADAVANDNDAG